jgi:hypothetical protein
MGELAEYKDLLTVPFPRDFPDEHEIFFLTVVTDESG